MLLSSLELCGNSGLFKKSGINELDNGLLIKADLHHLLDDKLLSIDPDTKRIKLHNKLRLTSYWQLNGVVLRNRVDGTQISDTYLRERFS